jgi:predicted nucleotide-binding protein (sugar kinase/HSP70/actin superfamily)
MKVGFPRMGYSYLAFKMVLEDLGHEPIVPAEPSKRTLDLGVRCSPEFACIPFKIITGTMIEAVERGAEVFVVTGGIGPCRAGYYGTLQQIIADELGNPLKVLILEPPSRYPLLLLRAIRRIKPRHISWLGLWEVLKRALRKLQVLEEAERLALRVRPYETRKGDTTRALKQALSVIDKAHSRDEIEAAGAEAQRLLKVVPVDSGRTPLKVGVIGEIYAVIEPAANFNLDEVLGEMGVLVEKTISVNHYTENNILADGEGDVRLAARPYLKTTIGGHGINSVGEAVISARRGFDGMVQVAPFSCIPEIVAKGILPRVSRDFGLPLLTLFIDEQTGDAGIRTRLEAFVDMLLQRREKTGPRSGSAYATAGP